MVMNSLSFCLSGNVLISPSLLKDSGADIEFLIDYFFFSFSALTILSHCLLASKIIFLSILCPVTCFSLDAFKIISLSLKSLLCVLVWVSLSSSYLEFIEIL